MYVQVQQANVDDDVVARSISQKLGDTPGVSYSEIANKAIDCGRVDLAIKVCSTWDFVVQFRSQFQTFSLLIFH